MIAQKCWKIIIANTVPDKIIPATPEEDRKQHWDYMLNGRKKDIKNNYFYDYKNRVCVVFELWTVNGENGSLFGMADDLVFQISGESSVHDIDNIRFLEIPRLSCVQYHINKTSCRMVDNKIYAVNHCFKSEREYECNDLLTAIPVDDIINLGKIIKL